MNDKTGKNSDCNERKRTENRRAMIYVLKRNDI